MNDSTNTLLGNAPSYRGAGRPIVGVITDQSHDGSLAAQSVDEKYLQALSEVADVNPFMIPSLGNVDDLPHLLARLDGLVLTGSASNVHPRLYDPTAEEALYQPFNANRDSTALSAIGIALDMDMPLFAICRGLQELNVFMGGSLVTGICESQHFSSHTPWDKDAPLDVRYGPSHVVTPVPGGLFARIADGLTCHVNSLHVQAIARLGDRLAVEARAEDGTIEVISVTERRFALGVQWHPEYNAAGNPLSRRLFQAFGDATRSYQACSAHLCTDESEITGGTR
ncbi:gamma-glutamyl-gamma-aminobutyrate hydrolase family protein [Pseudomonas sp. NPDC086278]|uniref:gamma-glutamyl-gamma-aminobutyrate hydrolase family protein n=1 Tax=Pseudomonas sp. NPDC086278 TaxID=3390646 RepID=UPI003CFDF4C9